MSELQRVRVTCKRGNGFWRGGRHWPNGHTEVELDKPAIEALLKEPLLVVALHDGKGWRVLSKDVPNAPSPAAGEPALESEVKDLEDTIRRLRDQLREERDAHEAERTKLLDQLADTSCQLETALTELGHRHERVTSLESEVASLQVQLEAATAPPPPPAAVPATEPPADKAKKK